MVYRIKVHASKLMVQKMISWYNDLQGESKIFGKNQAENQTKVA